MEINVSQTIQGKGTQLIDIVKIIKKYNKEFVIDDSDIYMSICSMGMQKEFKVVEKNPLKRLFVTKSKITILTEKLNKEFCKLMDKGARDKIKNPKANALYKLFIKIEAFSNTYGLDEIAIYGFLNAFGFEGNFKYSGDKYNSMEDIIETYKFIEELYYSKKVISL